MNQFTKLFALLGLSASMAFGAGCAAEVEDPESELALADEANDSAELAVSDAEENTAESEDALSTGGLGGWGGAGFIGGYGGCGIGRGFDCLAGGRHFIRGPYYGPCGGYGRGYFGYGHPYWAAAHGRIGGCL
ncbi:hypothetical protein [Polyangium spumosum]|uniref:Uncharacterized protein n=1 Tax=Polyangium spumosum TaxID=889282 RepID=A0A6N7Q3S5_9BACT|nr:hypothetical protein [Polyangium spumosum]MRG97866.1 hypothetical protein [Polyangium spumosum]